MSIGFLLLLCGYSFVAWPSDRIQIGGEWRLRLDPTDSGLAAHWYEQRVSFPDRIQLPGSTDEQHFGSKNEKREAGHLTRAYQYVGPSWYEREILIPDSWQGKRVTLLLERCHWETQVWLDDYSLGLRNSLSTPHVYEVGSVSSPNDPQRRGYLTPGSHRLTIRVDNRLKIDVGREWASAVTEEGPGNWNGIAGRMELSAVNPVWIDSVSAYPMVAGKSVHVKVRIRNSTGEPYPTNLRLRAGLRGDPAVRTESSGPVTVSAQPQTVIERDLALGREGQLWSEFSPSIYDLSASLGPAEEVRTTFGLRELSTRGKHLALNGSVILARGTVDNGSFPRRGYPPTDVPAWRVRFQTYKDYGFNHIRFHSWCPPDAAFAAADELGMMIQVESPMWIPDGRVSADSARIAFIHQEAEAIVDTYGNHPSFFFMTMGNELGSGLDIFLGDLVRSLQSRDPRHLYASTSAPDNMLRPDNYFVSAGPRWQNLRGDPRLENRPPDTYFDYRGYIEKIDRPVIAHELGQWTVFPNLDEGRKYHGPLQPRYLELYREALDKHGLLAEANRFRESSGALMVELYKEEIESILRTPNMGGFQVLGLTDWPGFGPAFIGVLDALNEPKGLISPERFRRFCGPTVLLLRMKKRTWRSGETLIAPLDIAHYGPEPPQDVAASWVVRDKSGRPVASGALPPVGVEMGGLTSLGELKIALGRLEAPARYSIETTGAGTANDWNIWVYPDRAAAAPAGIVVSKEWNDSTRAVLAGGGTVVLFPSAAKQANTTPTSLTTAFWALSWFPKRHETMGIVCDPAHPALALFPTDSHSDWQWWDLMSGSRAFVLNGAPDGLRPIVQVIDDAARSYRLGAVIEGRVGNGRLLATSFDLTTALDTRPAAGQLRASLLQYAASRDFRPETDLSVEYLNSLFASAGH
jgi:hypothetical protein